MGNAPPVKADSAVWRGSTKGPDADKEATDDLVARDVLTHA